MYKYIIGIVMCMILSGSLTCVLGQEMSDDVDHQLDSLITLLNTTPDGAGKLALLNDINYLQYNLDSSFKYASIELELAERLSSKAYIINANYYMGWCCLQKGDFEQSCKYYQNAISLCPRKYPGDILANSYYGLGCAYGELGDDNKTIICFKKALDLYELYENNKMMTDIYRQLAIVCASYHLFESCQDYLNKAIAIDSVRRDSLSLGDDYFTHGWNLYVKCYDDNSYELLRSAIDYMRKGYDLVKHYDDAYVLFWVCREMMFAYHDMAKLEDEAGKNIMLDSSLCFYKLTDSILNACSLDGYETYMDLWRAEDLAIRGDAKSAIASFDEIESRSDLDLDYKTNLFRLKAFAYEAVGDNVNALKYANKLYNIDRENFNRSFAIAATYLKYEDELLLQKKNKQRMKYITLTISLLVFMVTTVGAIVMLGLLRKRKLNRLLAMRNDEIVIKNSELNEYNAEILAQRDEIEAQRDNLEQTTHILMGSINYAKHIQDAVMISNESMREIFGDTLIYWRPMNVVSGDFYWAMQVNDYKLIVLADCTGHGVPGAFMSMFAMSSLNSIVPSLDFSVTMASDVLDMLRTKIVNELHQTTSSVESFESIDMTFCVIDKGKMKMQYAGANRPLSVARDGEIIVYKPDKMPVGFHVLRKGPFTNNIIDLKKNDILYMYSDGITDQFGVDAGNATTVKFTTKRLHNMLQNISCKPFSEQYEIIDKLMNDWRIMPDGTVVDQYDDQLLLGIRIS